MHRSHVLLAAAAVALCGCLASCGREAPPTEPVIRPVRYETVLAAGGMRERTFSGTAQAGVESRLSFKVGGYLRRVAVSVGDRVRAGQLIASLDHRDYDLAVEEAEASLANARAQQTNAKAILDRVYGLYENRNASRADLDAARAAKESADAQFDAAAKRLESSRLQRSYTTLRAPVAGAIAEVLVEVNENLAAGGAVAVLTSGERIEVTFQVPEQLIDAFGDIEKVEVSFDAIPGESFTAEVKEIGVASTAVATAFPVTVQLIRSDDRVRPGMAAEIEVQFETSGRSQILVPAFAVGEDPEGRFVYVVEPTKEGLGLTRRRSVVVEEQMSEGERIEILQGLEDGELVVTAGVSRIEDGMAVRLEGAEDGGP